MTRTSPPPSGFTLLEVLVALALTGFVVTVFLQLLSSSLRLEGKARSRTQTAFTARLTFDKLMDQDVRDEAFPWQGENESARWLFTVHPVETAKTRDELEQEIEGEPGEITLRLQNELYQYALEYAPQSGVSIRLAQLVTLPRNHFSLEFRNEHLSEPVSKGIEPDDIGIVPLETAPGELQ